MDLRDEILAQHPDPELLARIEWLAEVREHAAGGSWKTAADLLAAGAKTNRKISGEEDGREFVADYFFNILLEGDHYLEASALAWSRGLFEQRPVHVGRIFDALAQHNLVILLGASGMSKCLGPDVPVLLFDGTSKPACEVKAGDQLMGDDSRPRNVLSAHSGYGPMFRIKPKRGMEWTCNDQHILTIAIGDHVLDVPLFEYQQWSDERKIRSRQIRLIDHEERKSPFAIEGIGDGEYFGFEIDGNRRFLLGDFTVTHNTYSAAAYISLDVMRDPENTSVKFGSVNDTNLKGNLWSNLRTFQEQSLFPKELCPNETRMRMRPINARPDCGVDAVLFSKQRDSTGKIKGFHPKPFRLKPHPRYGNLTVVRILLDETQELSPGVQSDLGSPMSTIEEGVGTMKIVLTCNPIDEGKWVVQMAQPPGGWEEDKIDELRAWMAGQWFVLRLDGAHFENVKYAKTIFPGFLTRKAYDGYMRDGQPTPNWYIFARGFPPPGRAKETVVPSTWFDHAKGEPVFVGATMGILGGDLAFINDKAILAVGRYGLATGYLDWQGIEHRFNSRKQVNSFENRHVCVLDRIIELKARDNSGVSAEIKEWATSLMIEPNFCVLDMTGNGFGVVSDLQKFWGKVEGVHWKEKATPVKILVEDKFPANEQTTNRVSEMYWTLRRWIDLRVKALFINPNCEGWETLRRQLTTRAYKQDGIKIDIESKESYMKRFTISPDEADAVAMMCFAPRIRGLPLPALVDEEAVTVRSHGRKPGMRTSDRPASQQPNWTTPALHGAKEARLPTNLAR